MLQAQQGGKAAPEELSRKHPLGYVIYDVDYQGRRILYKTKALDNWEFDWDSTSIADKGIQISVTLPTIQNTSKHIVISNDTLMVAKETGPIWASQDTGDSTLKAEILATSERAVVFLLGLSQSAQKH